MFNNIKLKSPKQVTSYMSRKIYAKSTHKTSTISKKIVVRRLPPDMILSTFIDQVSPIPPHDYMYFVKADKEYGRHAFSRAYINFIHEKDMYLFKEKYDGYVFLSGKGIEYPAVVEFAPYPKVPKKSSRRYKDPKLATIETNSYYQLFVKTAQNSASKPAAAKDITEISTQNLMNYINQNDEKIKTTPLLMYLAKKKTEKPKICDDKWKTLNHKKYREHYGYVCFNSSTRHIKRSF